MGMGIDALSALSFLLELKLVLIMFKLEQNSWTLIGFNNHSRVPSD